MRVSLLVTCLGDALFPEVGVATVHLLRRLGVEVAFPETQTCCGQPFFNSGFHNHARDLAQHTIRTFAGEQLIDRLDAHLRRTRTRSTSPPRLEKP